MHVTIESESAESESAESESAEPERVDDGTPDIASFVGLLEEVSGVDFGAWSPAALRRQLTRHLTQGGYDSLEALVDVVTRDDARLAQLLVSLTADRPLFAGPARWRELRREVLPLLRTYPSIRAWVPACGSGESAYALAIVLDEAGLLSRSRIYATEAHDAVLAWARRGVMRKDEVAEAARGYVDAGGTSSFARYLVEDHDGFAFTTALRERICFAAHNVATDASVNEFHLILSPGAVGRFGPRLLRRTCELVRDSLGRFGVVVPGADDGVLFAGAPDLRPLASTVPMYRKEM